MVQNTIFSSVFGDKIILRRKKLDSLRLIIRPVSNDMDARCCLLKINDKIVVIVPVMYEPYGERAG
jgi:hypothetical protein